MSDVIREKVCSYACVGLTREHLAKLNTILDLLQPKLSCQWRVGSQAEADLIFHPYAFTENVRSRLQPFQHAVAVWHDEEPPHADEWHLEWPFRVGPVLYLLEHAEVRVIKPLTPPNGSKRPPTPSHQPNNHLTAVLKTWLRHRSLPHWHVLTSNHGFSLWIHATTLEYACEPNAVSATPGYWEDWSMPLPVANPAPSATERGLLIKLVWSLIENPKLPKPDWMFQDGVEIRLTSWPDLGEVNAPHWQIKLASLLAFEFSALDHLSRRIGREVHDVAGFATACDVFGLLEHRLIGLAGAHGGLPEPARNISSSQAPPPAAGGFLGLLRTIRDRLYGTVHP